MRKASVHASVIIAAQRVKQQLKFLAQKKIAIHSQCLARLQPRSARVLSRTKEAFYS